MQLQNIFDCLDPKSQYILSHSAKGLSDLRFTLASGPVQPNLEQRLCSSKFADMLTGGRITGQFVGLLLRAAGIRVPVSLTSYAVVGAAAYMGGATRMTLTTTVMVMETTGSLQLIVPIMITVFVAKVELGAQKNGCIEYSICP